MTYQNDPRKDFDRALDPAGRRRREGWGTGSIILASLAALAVVFGLFYALSNRSDTSFATRDRPPRVATSITK